MEDQTASERPERLPAQATKRECRQCGALIHRLERVCPGCGRHDPYIPTDADRAVWANFPGVQHAMDRIQEKAVNTALIEATLADIDAQEERCRLSIRYFKHRPFIRLFTDDLRRLCELAQKGNQ